MKNKSIWLLIGCFFILVMFYATSRDGQQDVPLTQAVPRSFEIQVTAIGVLDAAKSHMLSSEITGDVGKIISLVEDGRHVKEGDLLVKLDSAPFEEMIQQLESEATALESGVKAQQQVLEWEKNQIEKDIKAAEFNLQIAKLDLKRLTAGEGSLQISQYSVDASRAKQEYDKYIAYRNDLQQLKEKGFPNLSELEQAEDNISELKEKYQAAQNKLTSYKDHVFPALEQAAQAKVEKSDMDVIQTRNGGPFKIAKAIADLEETKGRLLSKQASLTQSRNELEKTTINAPSSGIAILFETFRDGEKRKPRIGDRVTRNQPILYLPDVSSMIVKTQIREIDLHKISLAQKALIQVDAYPSLQLEGQVNFIGSLATDMSSQGLGGKYFELTIAISQSKVSLRPGMTARVTIVADRIQDAISLPVSAVFQQNDQTFCYRSAGKRFERLPVQIGRQNQDFIEIRAGLNKDDMVSLIAPAGDDIINL